MFLNKNAQFLLFVGSFVFADSLPYHDKKYTPDWESLDSRPLPEWYDDAKIGIFMHFGVYSATGWGQGFWRNWAANKSEIVEFMEDYYPPNWTYQDFGPEIKMEFFDPNWFAEVVEKSGAKYYVFTSKHHEGFTNWPSTYTFGWNSMDIGPNKNVVKELKDAFEKTAPDVHFGLYYNLWEPFHPIFLKDKANNWKTREFPRNKMIPEAMELVETFKPDLFWADGANHENGTDSDYFGSKEFLAWLYNESPIKDNVVVNDRWGVECYGEHGGYYTYHDRFNPGVLQKHKFENSMSVDRGAWGIRQNIHVDKILSMDELIYQIVSTVSCNGNILMNVGPTKEGAILPIFEERLTQVGGWLNVNGESIYESRPWLFQNDSFSKDPEVWYTQSKDGSTVYGTALGWPMNDQNSLTLGDVKTGPDTEIHLLGYNQPLNFSSAEFESGVTIQFPPLQNFLKQCKEYCEWGYTLKMVHLIN